MSECTGGELGLWVTQNERVQLLGPQGRQGGGQAMSGPGSGQLGRAGLPGSSGAMGCSWVPDGALGNAAGESPHFRPGNHPRTVLLPQFQLQSGRTGGTEEYLSDEFPIQRKQDVCRAFEHL